MDNVKQYESDCREAFRDWLEIEGMRLNPEGFEHGIRNQNTMSRAQHIGMNLWLEDFRELFAPAPWKHGRVIHV